MKGRMKGTETRGTQFEFGRYALKALEPGWITSRQIEAARRAMTREIKRGGNVWIKIFPDKPIVNSIVPKGPRAPMGNDAWLEIKEMDVGNIFVIKFAILMFPNKS